MDSLERAQLSWGVFATREIGLTLTWIGTACWGVCFWWMHRLSARQEAMLKELHEMTQRIEQLSKAEHELISEVHPQVEKIKEHVEDVATAVARDQSKAADPR